MNDAPASLPPRIAVLLPCFNEAAAIGGVVAGFRTALPTARIHVCDNNSTDQTRAVATAAGARVGCERQQGKGHVIRRMFADVDADIYVLADGDGTYDPADAPAMIALLRAEQLDMVTGRRVATAAAAYRRFHRAGNRVISRLVGTIFGAGVSDILSGYRVFSRRFVKSFPALSSGFETETELVVHALELRMPIAERATAYRDRPHGSASKLRTTTDGLQILRTIVMLTRDVKPLPFLSGIGAVLLGAGLLLGGSVAAEFLRTRTVPRLPTAVLAASLVLLAAMLAIAGLVLDSVARGRKEIKRLAYLSIPGPPPP